MFKLPANLREIGDEAFMGCSSLSGGFDPPDTLETIGKRAFEGCDNLHITEHEVEPETVETGE